MVTSISQEHTALTSTGFPECVLLYYCPIYYYLCVLLKGKEDKQSSCNTDEQLSEAVSKAWVKIGIWYLNKQSLRFLSQILAHVGSERQRQQK